MGALPVLFLSILLPRDKQQLVSQLVKLRTESVHLSVDKEPGSVCTLNLHSQTLELNSEIFHIAYGKVVKI